VASNIVASDSKPSPILSALYSPCWTWPSILKPLPPAQAWPWSPSSPLSSGQQMWGLCRPSQGIWRWGSAWASEAHLVCGMALPPLRMWPGFVQPLWIQLLQVSVGITVIMTSDVSCELNRDTWIT
jgi:hypothetical protein